MIRGLLVLVQIVMVTLKLTDNIDISWWLVFIPLYILVGGYILIALIAIGFVLAAFNTKWDR